MSQENIMEISIQEYDAHLMKPVRLTSLKQVLDAISLTVELEELLDDDLSSDRILRMRTYEFTKKCCEHREFTC